MYVFKNNECLILHQVKNTKYIVTGNFGKYKTKTKTTQTLICSNCHSFAERKITLNTKNSAKYGKYGKYGQNSANSAKYGK
jgi:hypothetical protein